MRTAGRQSVVPHSRPWITEADRQTVVATLEASMIAEGELTGRFEREAAAYLGLAGGVAAPDGTTALYLALRALGAGPSDEVVIPTYVCEAVAQAVRWTGATPVLCDVGDDWCVNAATVRPALSRRTKCVVVVHTFGIVADARPIVELGVPVVEDLAQAFGASAPDGRAGGFGELAITSFHATKCLTSAEGGMAFARSEASAQSLRALKDSIARTPMSDLQASLGLSQLRRYPDFLERRQRIARRYRQALPALAPDRLHDRTMYFRFPVLVDGGVDTLMAEFADRGVLARRGVDALLDSTPGRFPGAESAFAHTVSLPIHPSMNDEEVDRAVAVATEVLG